MNKDKSGKGDATDWQQELAKELQNEKRSNEDNLNDLSPKSKQSNNFEINTYFDDEYYLP